MTLVRFDPVYTTYFKTNLKRIADYPSLLGYVRDIYQMDPVKGAINMNHIKTHYFTSHPHLNTFGVILAQISRFLLAVRSCRCRCTYLIQQKKNDTTAAILYALLFCFALAASSSYRFRMASLPFF